MGNFTSKAAGNWSSGGQTTWNEVGVPGNGDTVTSLNHAIAVDVNTTVGTSGPTGTAAITFGASGVLTINSGVQFTCRGDILCATGGTSRASIVQLGGSILEMDASQATTPLSQTYKIRLGGANADKCRFETQGTAGNRCTVRSNAGGGNAFFTRGGFTNTGFMVAAYTDFLRIGDSGNPFLGADLTTSNAISKLDLSNCTLDSCGLLDATLGGTPGAASIMSFVNVTHKNTVPATALKLTTGASPTGTRLVKGCIFDKDVTVNAASGWTFGGANTGDENLFNAGMTMAGSSAWATFRNAILRRGTTNQETAMGGMQDVLFMQDHTTANPHFVGLGTTLPAGTYTFNGCLFWFKGSDTAGDGILGENAGAATILAVQNCIVLPNGGAGLASCSLVSLLGNASLSVSMLHNTGMDGNSQALITYGETYASYAGMITGFKSNLVWRPSGTQGYKMFRDVAGNAITDTCSPANAGYNTGWNLAAGNNGKGYHASNNATVMFSSAPGTNDVDVNPGFVDSTRSIATWDTSLGGPGTVANALTELGKKNDATGYNSAYSIPALLAYLRGGFAPRNTALKNAGHDGVTIGAVEGVFGTQVLTESLGLSPLSGIH